MKLFLMVLGLTLLTRSAAISQKPKVCTTRFITQTITYNGSPNPSECWESVAYGIVIDTEKAKGFFSLPIKVLEPLKQRIGDAEVIVEVVYFDEPEDESGLTGRVIKVTLRGDVIFQDA